MHDVYFCSYFHSPQYQLKVLMGDQSGLYLGTLVSIRDILGEIGSPSTLPGSVLKVCVGGWLESKLSDRFG